jgi:hypothetical protein
MFEAKFLDGPMVGQVMGLSEFTTRFEVCQRRSTVPCLRALGPDDRIPFVPIDTVTYHFSVARGGFTVSDRGDTPDQFPADCVECLGRSLVIGFNHEAKMVAIMFRTNVLDGDIVQAMGFAQRVRAVWEPKGYVVVV